MLYPTPAALTITQHLNLPILNDGGNESPHLTRIFCDEIVWHSPRCLRHSFNISDAEATNMRISNWWKTGIACMRRPNAKCPC